MRRRHRGPARLSGTLAAHVAAHPTAGAVSGLVLEQVERALDQPVPHHVRGGAALVPRVSAWHSGARSIATARWATCWPRTIAAAGITFQAPVGRSSRISARRSSERPIYGLGAALVRRDWLLAVAVRRAARPAAATATTTASRSAFPPRGSTSSRPRTCATTRSRPIARPPPSPYASASWRWICSYGRNRGRAWASRRHLAWSMFGNTLCTPATRNCEMCWASLKTLAAIVVAAVTRSWRSGVDVNRAAARAIRAAPSRWRC